jgi:hypothetical protein
MKSTSTSKPVSISISVDEWRDIVTWMHASLDRTEQSPYGHFLLECEGTRRTWVTSDTAQLTVMRCEGPAPRGLADPSEPFSVLVNSRFFRRRNPQDVMLTVTPADDGRQQRFVTDGVEVILPEHPDDFVDWRTVLAGVTGAPVDVDTEHLRDACSAASIVPCGIHNTTDPVHAWVFIRDGKLHLETPWVHYPSTTVKVPVLGDAIDTEPSLVDIRRLIDLLSAIDFERTTLRLPAGAMLPIGLRSGDYEAVLAPIDRWGDERRLLEDLLCKFLEVDSVTADVDGDYPVTSPEGHRLWVRLVTDAEPASVQVFSVIANRVETTPDLLEELNSINATAAHIKVLLADGAVMAEVDLVAETLDLPELGNALRVVRHTAERYHDVLSAYFGPTVDEQDSER